MEWDGESGSLRYYDKAKKENIPVGNKFTFILLDQLGCIRGWHDATESGIYSNEVKDTRRDPFIVKAFKGQQPLAQGIYSDIRDRVANVGGKFHANLYIAFRNGDDLQIGSIILKGAALREWMEFAKASRADLYSKAIAINGCKEGKKGKITFQTPVFSTKDITSETNEEATKLDMILQSYLKAYLERPTTEKVEPKYDDGRELDSPAPTTDVDLDDIPF